jgi:hypothetical protein
VRAIGCFGLALGALLMAAPARAQTTGAYTTPGAFMNLFFDFTGSNEPDYPAGQPTLGQMLTQSVIAKEQGRPGPVVLVVGSDIYVYDSASGAKLAQQQFRADRASGFYEMTAISHIGPALAYLAQIKANGDARWRARLTSLRAHVEEVRALNRRAADNWLDRLNQPAWATRKSQIRNMVDYACARTLNYIDSLGIGSGENFTVGNVNDDFFNGTSAQYPIPFVNVMIGTFMLDALRGAVDVRDALARLNLDWPRAMVLVSSRAGSNVSAGLTEGTNWLVFFLKAVSGFTLPDDRIKIVPYAEVRPSLGQSQLAAADLSYYAQRVWGPLFYRKLISDEVFSEIPIIYLPDRPQLPGDYFVTRAGAIDQFMIRMKHSLRDAREMLSNTVAFWMVQELANKNWDAAAVDIPGLTTGFTVGVASYPATKLD